MRITRHQLRTIIKESLNEIKTVPSRWWEYEPDEVMSDIYWQRRQIPPSDPKEREIQWQSIKNQLEKKYPRPADAESSLQERRMETDVMRIVTRAITHGPKTHQELLANVLDEFPNTADEEIDTYIDNLEDSGDIIFDPRMQKYY